MDKLNKLFDIVGFDGCKHIILSAILTVIVNLILPIWVTCPLVLAIGIIKEIYDKSNGKGFAEYKDIACNIIGILIGVL